MTASGLDGRVALVTGGSRGIGKAVAGALLDAGARVTIVARKQAALDAAVEEFDDRRPGAVMAFAGNAGDPDAAQAAVAATVDRFGALDVLVNNAATNPYFGPLMDLDVPRAEKTVAVNQLGPLWWTQQAWKAWMADHGGSVINVTSIGAGRVERNFAFYNATKAALTHLTRSLASELAPKARVNAVAPGFVKTDLNRALWEADEAGVASRIPLGRTGQPADVASVVVFLAGDGAAWLTGETIVIDGGSMVEPGTLVG